MRALLTILALVAFAASSFAQGSDLKTGSAKPAAQKTKAIRDPKTGKFIKKAITAQSAKASPARDPKTGRFIKKVVGASGVSTGAIHTKIDPKSSKPARDPKTGKFIKASSSGKKAPARDPKTGKFIKGGGH